MANIFLPNTFQKPNMVADRLMYYLTPEEYMVLDKAIREILGWQDHIGERKAPLPLSVFMEGRLRRDGSRMSHGCGLSLGAVRAALQSLHEFGILVRMGDKPTAEGWLYFIQTDFDQIDWRGLQARKLGKRVKNEARAAKALATREDRVSSHDTLSLEVSSHDTLSLTSDDTLTLTSDDTPTSGHKTQGKTQSKTQTTPGDAGAGRLPKQNAQGTRVKALVPDPPVAAAPPNGHANGNGKPPKKPRKPHALSGHPAIAGWREAIRRNPRETQYEFVVGRLGDTPPNVPVLARVYQLWCARDYNPKNVDGITRWYAFAMASVDPLAWEPPVNDGGKTASLAELGKQVWNMTVGPAVEKGSRERRPTFNDPIINAAVEDVGWNVLCMRDEREVEVEFIQAYNRAARATVQGKQPDVTPINPAMQSLVSEMMNGLKQKGQAAIGRR